MVMGDQWYVAATKPRQEDRARDNLERQGFVAHLPRIVVRKLSRGAWADKIEPLFPGYIFVFFDTHHKSRALIRSMLGVAGLVRFGEHPANIEPGVINVLQSAADPGGSASPPAPALVL